MQCVKLLKGQKANTTAFEEFAQAEDDGGSFEENIKRLTAKLEDEFVDSARPEARVASKCSTGMTVGVAPEGQTASSRGCNPRRLGDKHRPAPVGAGQPVNPVGVGAILTGNLYLSVGPSLRRCAAAMEYGAWRCLALRRRARSRLG